MAKTGNNAATKALQQELKSLQKEPLEGFTVQLINDNLFEWEVAIFGKAICLSSTFLFFEFSLIRHRSVAAQKCRITEHELTPFPEIVVPVGLSKIVYI